VLHGRKLHGRLAGAAHLLALVAALHEVPASLGVHDIARRSGDQDPPAEVSLHATVNLARPSTLGLRADVAGWAITWHRPSGPASLDTTTEGRRATRDAFTERDRSRAHSHRRSHRDADHTVTRNPTRTAAPGEALPPGLRFLHTLA
jgi:hypothetical protein